jgi:hypothetical protein
LVLSKVIDSFLFSREPDEKRDDIAFPVNSDMIFDLLIVSAKQVNYQAGGTMEFLSIV